MMHTRDELARFTDGETRFVYARDRRDGALVLLRDGTATERRGYTKQHLECVISGCASPRLTTVSRTAGRDGYRHLRADVTHSPESAFHAQGKIRVAGWLRSVTKPDTTVEVEAPTSSSRSQVADILVTSASGARMAFEIQYSALTVDEWLRRHRSYRAQGIVDVWLFGHAGAQLRLTPKKRVRLSDVHHAVMRNGRRLLWLNPIDGHVAAAAVTRTAPGSDQLFFAAANTADRLVSLRAVRLDDCRLDGNGIIADRFAELGAEHAKYLRARSDWQTAKDELWRKIEGERSALFEQKQRSERGRLRAAQAQRAQAASRAAAAAAIKELSLSAEMNLAIVADWRGRWPAHLQYGAEITAPVDRNAWQVWAWERLSRNRALRPAEVADLLEQAGVDRAAADTAVIGWLRHLHFRAFVHWDGRIANLLAPTVTSNPLPALASTA